MDKQTHMHRAMLSVTHTLNAHTISHVHTHADGRWEKRHTKCVLCGSSLDVEGETVDILQWVSKKPGGTKKLKWL